MIESSLVWPYGVDCSSVVKGIVNIMIFQSLQFSAYALLLRMRLVVMLIVLALTAWTAFSVSLRLRYSREDSPYFSQCMKTYFDQYTGEKGHFVDLDTLLIVSPVSHLFQQACSIVKKQDSQGTPPIQGVHLFRDVYLEYLRQDIRRKHQVKQLIIYVNVDRMQSKFVYDHFGISNVLVDYIVQTMQDYNLSNINMNEASNRFDVVQLHGRQSQGGFKHVVYKIASLFGVYCRSLLGSILAGIIWMSFWIMVTRGIIIVGEVVYRLTGNSAIQRHFPFMNDSLNNLRTNRRKGTIKYLVLGYFVVSGILFYGITVFMNSLVKDMINGLYSASDNTTALLYLVVVEGISCLVLRTRTSIKYSPPFILRVYQICLFVSSMQPYRLPFFWSQLAFQISTIYLLLMVLLVEHPTTVSRCLSRPTKQHPRSLYFPSYNISWHSNIPPIWTYFVPPHGRSFFKAGHLSYVDRSYEILYCQLMGLPYDAEQHEPLQGAIFNQEVNMAGLAQ